MRLSHRANESIFYFLCTGIALILVVLSSRYHFALDVSRESRNSINARSQQIVAQLNNTVTINLYAGKNPGLVKTTRDLVSRYQLSSDKIEFNYINIEMDPSISRSLDIRQDGEIIIRLDDREKRINELSETAITNALSTLLVAGERRLVFLSGHGERRALGHANHDFGNFSGRLQKVGYSIETLTVGDQLPKPNASTTLVIASPERGFSPAEQLALAEYLNQGGNLLWLQDVSGDQAAKTLERLLPFETLPGVIVDTETQSAGLPRPDFALAKQYPAHATLQNISGSSLFPRAVALKLQETQDWKPTLLLKSSEKSWNETSEIAGNIQPDQHNEEVGPLGFAYALERHDKAFPQRVVVFGDGDFLANNWLGNGANVAVGEQLVNWLTQLDSASVPPATAALDRLVEIPQNALVALAISLLGLLPISLFGIAGWQWHKGQT